MCTWGTWPLPRRCWVHPEGLPKAPHPDCSEGTALGGATVREVFQREPLAELHLPHHSSWRSRQGGLPLHIHRGQTASGKSLPPRYLFPHQIPLSLMWYASLGGLNYKTNNKRYETNIILCPLSARFSKVTSDLEGFYMTHSSPAETSLKWPNFQTPGTLHFLNV